MGDASLSLFHKKKFRWGVGAFVSFTLFFAVFGDRGLIKIYKLRKEITRLQASAEYLTTENQRLKEDIKKMKNEHFFQEQSARETLGMVKENEIIYEFPD